MASNTEERKIKILLDGQQVTASLKQMEAAASIMNNQLKKMSADDPERKKLLKDFQDLRERMKQTKDEMYGVQKAGFAAKLGLDGVTSASGLMRLSFKAAVAAFLPLLAFQELVNLAKSFLGLVDHIDQVKGSLQQLTGAQGEALDQMYVRVEAISKTFKDDYNEVIKSANVLMKEFGLSHEQAFDLVEKGYLSGANASGDMLEQIKEYSTQFAVSGASAEEFIGVLAKGEKAGIFSDKAADTVKEFGLRVREQTKATGEALDAAFGQGFTDKVFTGINNGSMTTMDALRLVSKEMNNTQIPASQLQTVIADVFGGAGEDAGLPFIQSLHEVTGNIDDMIDSTNTLTSAQMDQLEAEKLLAEAQAELGETFSGTGATLSWFWTMLKTLGIGAIVAVINKVKGLRDIAVGIGYAFSSIGSSIGAAWDALMEGDLSGVKDAFKNMGSNSSKAYMEGYLSNEVEAQRDREKLRQQEEQVKVAAATEQAKKADEATRAEKDKAAKAAEKEAEKQRKKEAEALKKALEEYKSAKLKAEEETELLRINIRLTGVERDLALLKQKHQNELTELDKQKSAVLENAAATEEEKSALLAVYEEQRLLKEEEYKIAREEAEAEDKEAKQEKWFEDLEEEEEIKMLALEEQFLRTYDAEVLKEEAMLELKKSYLEQKLAYLVANGQGETAEAMKINNAILQIEKDKVDKAKQLAKERTDYENEMNGLRLSVAGDTLDGLMNFMNEESLAFQAFKQIRKGVSIAEAFLNLEKEKALNAATAAANPLNAVTSGAAGVAQLKLMNTLATIRTGISVAKIAAFAKGGSTVPMTEVDGMWQMASGYSEGSIGTFADGGNVSSARLGLIGEAGAEWVMPNWMLRSPKYAATYQWLESERQRGSVTAFADGGNTGAPNTPPIPSGNSEDMLKALQLLNSNFVGLAQRVEQWPTLLKVDYHAGTAEEVMQVRQELKQSSGW